MDTSGKALDAMPRQLKSLIKRLERVLDKAKSNDIFAYYSLLSKII